MITKPWTYWAIFFLWVALFFRTSEVQGGGPEPVTVIDIAVLWTPALGALQRDDLAEQARSWVEGVNGALMNSEARVRLRLVHSGKVTYPFNPEQLGHALEPHTAKLARLLDPNDGFFDAAQSIRDAVSADLLVVVTPGELDPAHAALVAAEPRLGFGVTSLKTEHEFARVVGRLMGCAGVENDPALGPVGSGAFADSQAFRLTNTHYSTLMGAEPVFPVFSTPGVQALGQPLGIAGVADNVRTWNVRAAEVAAFRAPLGSAQTPVVTWTLPRTGSVFAQGSEIQLEVAAQGSSANLREIEILAVDAVSGLPRLLPARMSRGTVSPHRAAIPGVLPQWGRLVARATDEAGVAAQSTVEFRVPPPNDDFVRRESIPPAGGSLLLRVGGSSLEPGEPAWEAGINGSVWWTWTAPGAGSLKLEWESSGLPRSHVRVFRGAAWGQWVAAGEMGPGTNSVIGTKAGEVLQIAAGLGQFFGPDPEERLRVTFFPALANDEFASAIELSGTNLAVTGHVFGARGEADIAAVPWLGDRGTVWWSWTPPHSGVALFRVIEPFPEFELGILEGNTPPTLALLGRAFSSESAVIPVTAGVPVRLVLSSLPEVSSAAEIHVTLLPEPAHREFARRRSIAGREGIFPIGMPGPAEPGVPETVSGYVAWLEWTAPESGAVAVGGNYPGSWLGSRVEVFTGNTLETLVPVPRRPSPPGDRALYFEAITGTTYQIALSWVDLFQLAEQLRNSRAPEPKLLLGYLPENDQFARRAVFEGNNVEVTIPSMLASREPGEPDPDLNWGLKSSLWFSWTAPQKGQVTLSLENPSPHFYPEGAVFRGEALNRLSFVRSRVSLDFPFVFEVVAGEEYHLAISGGFYEGSLSPTRLGWRFVPYSIPPNDDLAQRSSLGGASAGANFDLTHATAEPTDPHLPLAWKSSLPSLWWQWTAPGLGLATFLADNAALGVSRVQPDGSLSLVADGNSQRLAALRAAAGETLMVMVAGEGPGGLTIRWTPEWENDRLAGRAELGQEITANGDVVFSAEAQTHGAASGPEDAQLSGTNRTGHSRWWTWRPLVNGIATILAQVDTTAHVELFEVLPAGNLRKISYRQTAYMPGFRCHVESGREYAIAVDGVDGSDARFSLWVRLTPDGPPPGNDLFARANILEGLRLRVAGSHRAATRETGEPGFDAQPARRSLWWRWRAPQTGSVTVRAYPESQVIGESLDQYPSGTAASPTAPRLAVLQGASWDDLDWAPQAGPSQALRPLERAIRFRAEAGTTYRIVVDASDKAPNEVGEFALELIVGANGDSLADAQVVTGENPLLTGTLEGATPDGWRPNGGSPANIWWLWTAPRDLRVTLHAWDVGWAVFDSPSGVPLVTSFGSSGAAVRRDFLASAGRTYWMSAYGSPGRPLLVELDALPVPANDAFDGRLPLTGDRVRVAMRAENASQEAGEPNHGTLNRPSLWWSWKAPRSGDFLVTTGWEPQAAVSDPWDQVARAECFVYAGDNLSALTLVGDSSPFLPVSSLQPRRAVFTAVAGQTYQIAACPNLEGQRLWSEFAYEVRLAIDALPDNRTPESAIELAGPAASWQGVVRPGSEGLWWRWTAPASGRVVMGGGPPGFEAEGQLRPAIQVFRREGAGTLARLESDGLGAGRWEGMALAGETWWIQVLQAPNPFLPPPPWELAFDLSLALERSWGDNDAFAARTRLGGARPVIFGSNEDAGGPALGGVAGGGSQWWEWTVPETGRWYVSVVQPWDLELPIEVYRGSTLATLASVPRDPGMLLGSFSFYATAGEVLPIAVGRRGIPIRFEVHLRRLPPPPNDEFGRATELPSDAEGFTTVGMGATTEPGEPGHGTGRAKGSRWWSWTAPVTALMAVRISGEVIWNPPAVAVYRGDLLNQLISVGGNGEGGNPAREFAFAAEAGVTYRLAVDTPYPDDPRSYYLALEPVSGPENDSFTARISLTGARVQTVGFNGAATLEVGEPQAGQTATAATLWWSWTAPASGTTTIHTGGSEMDTGLAVFGGGQWPQLTPVAVNDDAPDQLFGIPAGFSRVSFVAQAGVTYAIQVGSVGGGRGQLRLSIVGPELPGPVVSGIEPSAGVGRLRLRGRAGQSVRILVSEDLHTWREAGRVQFVGAEDVTWQDPGEPSEVRFYQLVVGN